MSEGSSIINLSGLTKPVTVLIEKISDATGVFYEPTKIRKKALAEAEASITMADAKAKTDLIEAESSIKRTDLQKRAENRWLKQEERKQKNIESIITKAIPMVESDAKTEEIEEDWLAYFFKNCDIVSDEERQTLWAKMLAGEANQAGKYSRRTINFVATMDKKDAELFTRLCQFTWKIGSENPIIFDWESEVIKKAGIIFIDFSHLDSIGLIDFNVNNSFYMNLENLPKVLFMCPYSYFTRNGFFHLENTQKFNNLKKLREGQTRFTQIGRELAPICGAVENEEFFMETIQKYYKDGVIISSKWPQE